MFSVYNIELWAFHFIQIFQDLHLSQTASPFQFPYKLDLLIVLALQLTSLTDEKNLGDLFTHDF